ncbi:glycosyltransferase [Hyunsoonleella sp. SJ7]|uniref:Glycosyltransferase n=1 Tax=Hyunsoonleella aquatilis TaxID=2762758 RepID=A0A923H9L0_9FLAO|nr:glycosyltransferase [Hyunsoonleella aquatilis]MBC3758988.1 glycosyltransferase [Hyunsoonleella aquatilis]
MVKKNPKNTKILFILPSLVAGGAERVVSFISRNLNEEKFESHLLVIGFEKDSVYDSLGSNVTFLNKPRVSSSIFALISSISKFKPDIVFSCMAHLNIVMGLVSLFFPNIKFIGREATVLSSDNRTVENKSIIVWVIQKITKALYRKLDFLVCQSFDMKNDMIKTFGFSEEKIEVINNPISSLPPINTEYTSSKSTRRFITVGRLSLEKGHIRLLKILSKVKFDYKYTIVGNGDQKEVLFTEAKKLGIFDKIEHIPFTREVNNYLSQHDIFLQGSYVEGFPNAVLESCVVGTPVIGFNVPGGTKEIIINNVNGKLVENEKEFLKELNKDSNYSFDRFEVRKSVVDKFKKEKIMKKYENLFSRMI